MIYILCIVPPYKHAHHYIGYSANVAERISQNMSKSSKASPLIIAAINAGSIVTQTAEWEGDRTVERKLKRRGSAKQLCPVCRVEYLKRKASQRRALRRRHGSRFNVSNW